MKVDKTSKTYKNLERALQAECTAYTKYLFYSNAANKEGYGYIGKIFKETANNEKEHGEQWFDILYPDNKDTYCNLLDAIEEEHYENLVMYRKYEQVARDEGYDDVADEFKRVGSVESHHEVQYEVLATLLKNKELFNSQQELVWHCSKCGYEEPGCEPPKECPLCGHAQGYYAPRKPIYY